MSCSALSRRVLSGQEYCWPLSQEYGSMPCRTLTCPGQENSSFVSMTSGDGHLNWLPAIVTILLIALPIARFLTRRYLRGKDFATQLSQIYEANVSSTIERFHHGRLAWGAELVLQSCPDLSIGWPPRDITIHRQPTEFRLQDGNLERAFRRWIKTKEARPDLPGTGLRLTRNPAAFSDNPDLQLDVERCPWACTMFFKDNVAILAAERSRYIDKAIQGPIEFPTTSPFMPLSRPPMVGCC